MSTPKPSQRSLSAYRFLLTRRWLGLLLAVLAIALACYALGRWQFHRYDERADRNDATRANVKAEPVPVEDLMSTLSPPVEDDQWRQVRASGTYDVDHQLSVLYRTRDGAPGVDVVTPLVTDSGAGVLVDRGWVQTTGNGNRPVGVPDPPSGVVTVTGWLRLDADDGGSRVTPSEGSVRSISSTAIGETVPYDVYRGFVDLTAEEPGVTPSPELADPPDISAGPSFFYGVQWWFFGVLALGFWVYFAWAERNQPHRPEGRAPVGRATPKVTERG